MPATDSGASAAAPPPLPPPLAGSVAPILAELAHAVGRGRRRALPLLGPHAALSVHFADAAPRNWNASMLLSGPYGDIELLDGARFLRALSGIDPGQCASAHGQHWPWLRAALLARLDGTPFGPAHALEAGGPAAGPTLRLTLRSAGHAIVTHARATERSWLQLLAAGWARERAPLAAYAELPLTLPLRLARHRLPAGAARTLRPGDVIVPAGPAFDCTGHGTVRWGALVARVQFQAPGRLFIIALENHMDTTHWDRTAERDDGDGEHEHDEHDGDDEHEHDEHDGDDEHDDEHDGDGERGGEAVPRGTDSWPDGVDGVDVTLDFELGRVQLTLGALRGIGAGTVLLLDQANPALIAIVAGGRRLGSGEAVDVGGQLGVRITAWGTP